MPFTPSRVSLMILALLVVGSQVMLHSNIIRVSTAFHIFNSERIRWNQFQRCHPLSPLTKRFGRQRPNRNEDEQGNQGGKDTSMISFNKIKSVKKENLPTKVCVVCNRPFTWRKKWERCWDEVTTCSKKCNGERRSGPK
jgi:hypothetical protein